MFKKSYSPCFPLPVFRVKVICLLVLSFVWLVACNNSPDSATTESQSGENTALTESVDNEPIAESEMSAEGEEAIVMEEAEPTEAEAVEVEEAQPTEEEAAAAEESESTEEEAEAAAEETEEAAGAAAESDASEQMADVAPQSHPMDPLTTAEYGQVLSLLSGAGHTDASSRFSLVTLQEMPKADVLAWQPGDEIQRTAFAIVKQGTQTFEAVIDLSNEAVVSWTEIPGVQPGVLVEEIINVSILVSTDPDMLAAFAERGVTNPDNIFCQPLAVGYYNIPERQGRRLLHSPCMYVADDSVSLFSRPIEGVHAIVDVDTGEIVEIVDSAVIPISEDPGSFDEASVGELRPALKPVVLHQPNGANFSINGHMISWEKWSIHQRMDKRSGLVVSSVTYQDGEQLRPVLYQGSLSEIFVPYMDPSGNWFSRTFMDEGEYGFGYNATPLGVGQDCPETAVFVDAVLSDDLGEPYLAEDVICIFERNIGDPAWRHFDNIFGNPYEGRPAVELVVRMIGTIGN